MAAFSIEQSFLGTQRIVAREWPLLLPVMLAFMVLPSFATDLLVPEALRTGLTAAMEAGNPAPIMQAARWLFPLSIVLFLCGSLGGLALTALAVVPRISVKEAILLAFRRLPVMIGVLVLLFAGLMAAAFVVTLVLFMLRLDMRVVQSLLFGALSGMVIVAAARLSVLNGIILTRRVGPMAAISESWHLTRKLFWRLFAGFAVYVVGGMIVVLALGSAIGAVVLLAGNGLGAPDLAFAVNAFVSRLLAALVGAGLHLLGAVYFLQLGGSSRGI
ncbi:hypothetical protein [uncultured Sphingomonas sp.]|uniref:hypothetical protein n=1 Tax=uncultured Sphingomonas sp. TaxID=158754 RepID=UPI0025F1C1D0|nr:hypothetical protein [uncultured Sphingomonas sp.]